MLFNHTIPMELRRESEIYIPHAIGLHRILLESFVGPPFDGAVARHLDADPGNNSISNLAWGTVQENAIDRLRHDGAKPNASTENRVKNNKLFAADIPVIYRRYLAGTSSKELAAEYNVTVTAIKLIIDGKTWKHVAREPNRDDSSWR